MKKYIFIHNYIIVFELMRTNYLPSKRWCTMHKVNYQYYFLKIWLNECYLIDKNILLSYNNWMFHKFFENLNNQFWHFIGFKSNISFLTAPYQIFYNLINTSESILTGQNFINLRNRILSIQCYLKLRLIEIINKYMYSEFPIYMFPSTKLQFLLIKV